jgi:VCBS repeat-containing protein
MVWKINESSDFSGIGKAKVANPSPADVKNANAVAEQASAVDSGAATSAASGGIGTLLVGTSSYIGRSGIVAGTNADDPLNNGKLQLGLLGIFLEAQNAVKSLSGAARAQAMADFIGSNTLATIHEGYIAIDVAATNGDGASILDDLAAIGLIRGAAFGASAGGLLPLDAIDNLAALDTVKFARPAYAMTNTGSVTGQDDLAIDAPDARADYSVDGTGLTVGILSDSFDTYSGSIKYAQDVTSGDLPNDVNILADSPGGTDEGRAMAQLVYDIAPGADLAFHTAFVSMADFAQGILDLRDAGSDIIVDDVTYFAEPMFQDGILSQAINTVVADGAMYFTSAGNGADLSYESAWRDSGQTITSGGETWALFDFDPGAGIDTRLSISVSSTSIFIFQWDEAFFSVSGGAGAQTDLDLLFFNSAGTLVAVVGTNNIGGDALELAQSGSGNISVAFGKYLSAGATDDPNFVKMIINGSATINEFATNSSTSYGHPDAAGAISVGAAGFDDTPAFGQTPPRAENFTSKGGTTLLFNEEGERYISPITRGVDFTAPDGSNTTFFFNDTSRDADSLPNFFGTSAAAPNAAALAALMMQHDPTASLARIEKALADSAIDILTLRNNSNVGAGFDAHTGAGLIQASAAFAALDDDAGPLLSVFRQTTYVDSDVDGLVDPGNVLHTTVLITNNGVDAAINVVLADSAPGTTLDFSSVKVNGATVVPAVDGSIALGDLAVDASVTVTFDLLTTSQVVVGPYTQQANVTADAGVTATSNTETLTFDTANTLSLGNVIFNDADENGLFGNGEIGIAGVALSLYADDDNNGVADDDAIATTTTAAGGAYLFANLAPGNYIVGVDAANFGTGSVMEGFTVTTDAGDPDNNVNNDSNGALVGGDVLSQSITLSVGGEPTTDGDSDTNTNLSLDIGFISANLPPVAVNDSYSVDEDDTLIAVTSVLANDTDADNDGLTAELVATTASGILTLATDGTFTYQPSANIFGQDSFTYRAFDGFGYSNTATVTITVNPVNDVPVIFSNGGGDTAAINVAEGTTAVTTVAATDDDVTDPMDYFIVGGADADKFELDQGTGALTFITAPDAGNPTDVGGDNVYDVIVSATDSIDSDTQAIAVTVFDPDLNAAPVAVDDNYSVDEDGTLTVLAAAGLLANDTDADMDTLTPLLVSGPVNGSITVMLDGSFVYTPGINYSGTETFTYRANDGFTNGNLATVTITINSVNDAPEITSNGGDATAEISIAENTASVTTVTASDVDGGPVMMAEAAPTGLAGTKGANAAPQADPLGITYTISGGADAALFVINEDTGALSFIAAPDFEDPADAGLGNDYEVTVRATDNGGLFDEQTLSVVVTNVNDAPELTIAASQPVYDQNQAVVSEDALNISQFVAAESFTLTAATTLAFFDALLEDNGFAEDDSFDEFGGTLSWAIYAADPGGGPGTLLFTGSDANPILTDTGLLSGYDNDIFNAKISLGAVSLAAGDYWIALHEGEWLSPYDNSPIYWINSGNDPDPASPAALATDETNPVYQAAATTLAFRLSEALPGLTATEQVPLDLAGLIRVTDQDAGIGELVVTLAVTYGVLAISAGATGAAVTGSGTGSVTVTGTLAELEALLQGTEGATLTYTANAEDPQLSTALIVTVDDQGNTGSGGAQTDAGSIVINITPVDDAPVISSNEGGDTAAISIAENTTAVTTVVATDPEGATVTYSITGGADSALFDIDEETGALIFLAAPDFETPADDGTDNIYDVIVTASAGALADTQAIAVTVTNVNETPVNTLPATFSGTEDTTLALTGISVADPDAGSNEVQLTFQAPGFALTVATDVAGGLTAGQVSNNGSGTIIIAATIAQINATLAATDGFTIAPPADFNGDTTLTMFITDGGSTGSGGQKSDIDTTTITFAAVADAPVITSNGGGDTAAISVAEDATAVTTVVATDGDGDTLGYSITGGADAALFDIDEDTGALTFITAPNFEAPADAGSNNVYDVIVTASDGTLSDSQAIAVTILDGPDNVAPVSVNDAYNANEDVTLNVSAASGVLANDTDANADALTAILVTGPAHGTLTLNADGSFSYRGSANYNGPDSFTYKTNDGEFDGNTATVSLNVRSVNDAPVLAVPIADQTSPEDDAWTFVVPAGTFTDIDTPVLMLSATLDDGSPLPSWLSFDPATRTFSGTPPQDFNGSYDITVTASDGVNTVSDTFELDITPVFDPPVNTPPEAANDTALTVRNTPVSFDASLLLVNDVDPQGDRLTITGVTNGTRGSVVLNGTTVTFTPEAGYTGNATFTYRVVDTSGASDTATVTVFVTAPPNSRPVVSPALENFTTFEGTAVSIMVKATDADGDALTYAVSGDAHGELTGGTGGAFLYTPDEGFIGTDSVIITVSDGKGGTAQYEATITVLDFGAPEEFRLLAVDGWAGEIGGNGTVFGTEGFQDVTVLDVAGYISFDPSFNAGNDIIRLSGDAADWDIVRFGSSAILSDGDTVVTLPVGVVGQPIVFDDGARSLVFDTESGSMFIGDQLFTTTFVPITADSDGSVLPGTADDEAVARIQLNEGGDVHAGGTIDVFGTDQAEDVFLTYGAITLDPSFNKGGDTLTLDGDASDFSAVLEGSNVVLDGNGYILTIPAGPAGIDIVFDDGTRELLFDTVAEVVLIDSQVITLTVTPLSDIG